MRASKLLDEKMGVLAHMGRVAREEAHAAGVSAYFIDTEDPNQIIEERPDGKRVHVARGDITGTIAAE